MSRVNISPMPAITMEDDLGIVYLIETAQQFWSELEDVLMLPPEPPTLSLLDMTLRRFIALCATYHEQYLQSPLQLEHALDLILDSELFQFHSERMSEIIVDDLQQTTDPHLQFISYHLLLTYGQRRTELFRSHKRWQSLLPLLMDHVLVEIDPDVEDTYFGLGAGGNGGVGVPVPIEAKLRTLGVKILYEVCRVQKLTVADLRIFEDVFIDYLFDLVEQTRYMQDDTFNYSVIKLIVALNEQFMVASLGAESSQLDSSSRTEGESKNRVIRVLMRRLGLSKTFGENMIFMLNRAKRTPEDLCMQLLILKILYVLFTTKGTEEYFYTNDLRVLVDVFLRELSDLDEDSEALKHTYLRVLHPLLTKTQLRNTPYKRPQILYALEGLIGNTKVRDINHTTKRLVDRCLSGEWCVQLRASSSSSFSSGTGVGEVTNGFGRPGLGGPKRDRESDTASDVSTPTGAVFSPTSQAQLERTGSLKRGIGSKSVENLRLREGKTKEVGGGPPRPPLDKLRRPSNASTHSLPTAPPSGIMSPTSPIRRSTADTTSHSHHHHHNHHPTYQISPSHSNLSFSPLSPPSPISPISATSEPPQPPRRRPPPPAPPKRRKPPAIPVQVITTVRSSEPSPLGRGAFETR